MSDEKPTTFYDLDFHFTTGDPLFVTVEEGKDRIQDIAHCTHCGRAAMTKVTVVDDDVETTMTVHNDKLNAAQSTKRVVKPRQHGDSILELS